MKHICQKREGGRCACTTPPEITKDLLTEACKTNLNTIVQ